MDSGAALFFVIILFFIFFIVYKRNMLTKMFSLNFRSSSEHLQDELQQAADIIIQRLEKRIAELESLLRESDEKISRLQYYIDETDKLLTVLPNNKINSYSRNSNQPNKYKTQFSDFARELSLVQKQINMNTDSLTNNYSDMEGKDIKTIMLSMATNGYSDVDIARATKMGLSEVKLFLQLNK